MKYFVFSDIKNIFDSKKIIIFYYSFLFLLFIFLKINFSTDSGDVFLLTNILGISFSGDQSFIYQLIYFLNTAFFSFLSLSFLFRDVRTNTVFLFLRIHPKKYIQYRLINTFLILCLFKLFNYLLVIIIFGLFDMSIFNFILCFVKDLFYNLFLGLLLLFFLILLSLKKKIILTVSFMLVIGLCFFPINIINVKLYFVIVGIFILMFLIFILFQKKYVHLFETIGNGG